VNGPRDSCPPREAHFSDRIKFCCRESFIDGELPFGSQVSIPVVSARQQLADFRLHEDGLHDTWKKSVLAGVTWNRLV
jgi:hypothetical protein